MRPPEHARLLGLERWAAARVQGWSAGGALAVAVVGVAVAGGLDLGVARALGQELPAAALYVAPIGIAAWIAGRRSGWLVAVLAAAVEAGAAAIRLGGAVRPLAFGTRTLFELLVFLGTADLLSFLRMRLEGERAMSRTDALTGLGNSRAFFELAAVELERSRRRAQPVTAAYFDVDGFKEVNDTRGHGAGNALLRAMGESLRASVRGHDVAARVGGDEFVLLFAETGPDQARFAAERVRHRLVEDLKAAGFSNTVSVGVATFLSAPARVEELVGVSDRAMYAVKHGRKDGIRYEVVTAPPVPPEPRWQRERARA
jgi:diguanylate cyclase (GGDEF)-like protein